MHHIYFCTKNKTYYIFEVPQRHRKMEIPFSFKRFIYSLSKQTFIPKM